MLGRWDHRVARLVGLAFVILGAWVLAVNLIEPRYSDWIMAWVLGSGVLGAAGGLAFLLSFDGPNRMRTRGVRFLGWMGMVVLAVLPWSFWFLMVLLALLVIPTLLVPPDPPETPSP